MRPRPTEEIQTNVSLNEARHFKIKASAQAFRLLVDQYRLPIRATVREIITNAVDIHIRTGQTRPIEITTPSILNNFTFSVCDFGTGLSDDELDMYYATFFSSSKHDTEEETGELGLGCKCPLTYTDQFFIESRQHGYKTLSSIFIGGDGVPRILKQGVTDYVGPNGLTVSIPVQSADVQKFNDEIARTISYAGAERFLHPYETLPEREAWFTYEHLDTITVRFVKGPVNNATVIMGGVDYEVQLSELPWEIRRYVEDFRTEIIAPLGTFEIHPSRESLIFRTSTIALLEEIYKQAFQYLREHIAETIDSYDSLHDVLETFWPLRGGFRYLAVNISSGNTLEFIWRGINLRALAFNEELTLQTANQNYRSKITISKPAEKELDLFDMTYPFTWCYKSGRTSVKEYVKAHTSPNKGILVISGPLEEARHLVETVLGDTLNIIPRAAKKVRGTTVRLPGYAEEEKSKFVYNVCDQHGNHSLRPFGDLLYATDVLILAKDGNEINSRVLLVSELITLHRTLLFVTIPESHTRVRNHPCWKTLDEVLADPKLCTVHYKTVAKYKAMKTILSDHNWYDTFETSFLRYLEQIDEAAWWYTVRDRIIYDWITRSKFDALNTYFPTIEADMTWVDYAMAVKDAAIHVAIKYKTLHRIFKALRYEDDLLSQAVTDWYIGANS